MMFPGFADWSAAWDSFVAAPEKHSSSSIMSIIGIYAELSARLLKFVRRLINLSKYIKIRPRR